MLSMNQGELGTPDLFDSYDILEKETQIPLQRFVPTTQAK